MTTDDDSEPPLMHPTFFQLKAKPPAAMGLLPFPPPQPPSNPNVPPIFVMAPDPSAHPPSGHPAQVGWAEQGDMCCLNVWPLKRGAWGCLCDLAT